MNDIINGETSCWLLVVGGGDRAHEGGLGQMRPEKIPLVHFVERCHDLAPFQEEGCVAIWEESKKVG